MKALKSSSQSELKKSYKKNKYSCVLKKFVSLLVFLLG